jgi:hypothetical protein
MIDRRLRPFETRLFMMPRAEEFARLDSQRPIEKERSQEQPAGGGAIQSENWPAPFSPSGYGAGAGKQRFWSVQGNLTTKGKIMTRHLLSRLQIAGSAFAVLFGLATVAYGGVPSMNVTVFDGTGKVAFKGPMSAKATFATRTLDPGDYVVQFNSKSPALKDNQYLLVVSAGKKKVIAAAVRGEKFAGGGAAMKIQVTPGSGITGQILKEEATARGDDLTYRVIDGKRFVWVNAQLGSNLGGRWVLESLAPSENVLAWRTEDLQKRQDRGGEGSMITYRDQYWMKGRTF